MFELCKWWLFLFFSWYYYLIAMQTPNWLKSVEKVFEWKNQNKYKKNCFVQNSKFAWWSRDIYLVNKYWHKYTLRWNMVTFFHTSCMTSKNIKITIKLEQNSIFFYLLLKKRVFFQLSDIQFSSLCIVLCIYCDLLILTNRSSVVYKK